jgi:hypothetical protein
VQQQHQKYPNHRQMDCKNILLFPKNEREPESQRNAFDKYFAILALRATGRNSKKALGSHTQLAIQLAY